MDIFSLYNSTLKLIDSQIFISKFNPEIIKLFTDSLGLMFSPKEQEGNVCLANSHEVRPEFKETFTSKDLLDYLYAIIHSSAYRENHKENVKIDSQNIPIQTDKVKFWKLVQLGGELRKIHLLKSDIEEYGSLQYSKDDDYQSAQKWLQDCKGQKHIREDITHYQQIVVALTKTVQIVKKIDILDA